MLWKHVFPMPTISYQHQRKPKMAAADRQPWENASTAAFIVSLALVACRGIDGGFDPGGARSAGRLDSHALGAGAGNVDRARFVLLSAGADFALSGGARSNLLAQSIMALLADAGAWRLGSVERLVGLRQICLARLGVAFRVGDGLSLVGFTARRSWIQMRLVAGLALGVLLALLCSGYYYHLGKRRRFEIISSRIRMRYFGRITSRLIPPKICSFASECWAPSRWDSVLRPTATPPSS